MRTTESLVEVLAVVFVVMVFAVVWIPAVQFMFKGQAFFRFPQTGSFWFFLVAFSLPAIGAIVVFIAIYQWLSTE
jgi:hypothetical protein